MTIHRKLLSTTNPQLEVFGSISLEFDYFCNAYDPICVTQWQLREKLESQEPR
jgi:hypothetical protein